MSWQSLGHFLSMGGYGLYVWGSYGATVVVALIEIALLRRRMRIARLIVSVTSPKPERVG